MKIAPQSQPARAILHKMVAAPALDDSIRDTLYSDLEKIPAPWLSFLHDYGLQIAALKDGQTLADSPAMRKFAVPPS